MALINWVVGVIKFAISLCLLLGMLFSIFCVLYSGYDLLKHGWSVGTGGMAVVFMFATYLLDKLNTLVNNFSLSKHRPSGKRTTNSGEYYGGGYSEFNSTPSMDNFVYSTYQPTINEPDWAGAYKTIHDQCFNTDPLVANRHENAYFNPSSDLNKSLSGGY